MRGDRFRYLRWGVMLGTLGGLTVGTLFFAELARGPRMRDQVHLRTYEAKMPLPPAGSVPVGPGPPVIEESQSNPLPSSPAAIERGRVYYAYYCLFCHGEDGRGGPVGTSYMPVPADLNRPEIAAYGDGRLLRASLTGIGHDPVLPRIVRPEHRWYLVLYVRDLAAGEKRPSAALP